MGFPYFIRSCGDTTSWQYFGADFLYQDSIIRIAVVD